MTRRSSQFLSQSKTAPPPIRTVCPWNPPVKQWGKPHHGAGYCRPLTASLVSPGLASSSTSPPARAGSPSDKSTRLQDRTVIILEKWLPELQIQGLGLLCGSRHRPSSDLDLLIPSCRIRYRNCGGHGKDTERPHVINRPGWTHHLQAAAAGDLTRAGTSLKGSQGPNCLCPGPAGTGEPPPASLISAGGVPASCLPRMLHC